MRRLAALLPDGLSAEQRALYDAILGGPRGRGVTGEAGLVELTTLVGYYGILATQLRLFRVPLPPGVAAVFGEPAQ